MKKRILSMALASALVVGGLAGCGSGSNDNAGSATTGSDIKIGYINLADTDVFCQTLEKSFVAQAEAKGWSVECTDGNNDSQKQIDQASSFIAKGVDAIVLVPCDESGSAPVIETASAQDVPVFTLSSNVKTDADVSWSFTGPNNEQAGEEEGKYILEQLGNDAKICYLAGTAGMSHATARREGLLNALEGTNIELLDDQDGDYVKDEGMRITEAWIQKYTDGQGGVTFDAIVAANDQMALGAIEALKGASIPVGTDEGEVLVTGVDGSDDAITAIQEGTMAMTALQDAPAEAENIVNAIETVLDGGTAEAEYSIPFIPVTSDNVEEYKDHNKVS